MAANKSVNKLTKADKQALHSTLNARFNIPLGQLRQLIDDSDSTLTRADIARALLAYCRSLTKS